KALFETPTVAGLATTIANGTAGEAAPAPLGAQTRSDRLPLSFAQQRLWFLDQLEPGSAVYNVPAALRMKGRLDVEALRRTVETIVERHEVLRTTFVAQDGEPVQKIQPPVAWSLATLDLSEAELAACAQAEASKPFDLATGPLLRTTLVRLADDEHVLLLTMHHVVSDAWSLGVLVREMAALYSAYAQGEIPTLPQ